jgi:uncharacterized FlaG/YvyC family protein
MPIDLRLLVGQDILWNELELSLRLRSTADEGLADIYSSHVARLRQAQFEARQAKHQVELHRNQMKIKKEQASDKEVLQKLKDNLRQAQGELNDLLFRIPNYIDTEIHTMIENDTEKEIQQEDMVTKNNNKSRKDGDIVEQLMFCIGGYERLGRATALTQRGTNLFGAVEQWMIQSCHEMSEMVMTESFELLAMLPMDTATYQRQCGATSSPQNHHLDDTIMAPSWISLVEHHLARDEAYFDRSLPQAYVLTCRDAVCHDSLPFKSSRQSAWYQDLSIQHNIQILSMTGPSLALDSRRLQIAWMNHLRNAYQQLAPKSRLQIRSVPVSALSPNEASRLVLEGFMPHDIKPIQLASLSNLLDYCSAGLRHGNSIDKRNVHLLQGSVCRVGLAVEWMLQHCQLGENHDGIVLPDCLEHQATISFCRRIVKKKDGRQFVQSISIPKPLPAATNVSDQYETLIFGDDTTMAMTPERIRLEAASCPFDFLPFYYR